MVDVLGDGGHLQLAALLQVARSETPLASVVNERRVGDRAGPEKPVDVCRARLLGASPGARFRRLSRRFFFAAAQSGELTTQFLYNKS